MRLAGLNPARGRGNTPQPPPAPRAGRCGPDRVRADAAAGRRVRDPAAGRRGVQGAVAGGQRPLHCRPGRRSPVGDLLRARRAAAGHPCRPRRPGRRHRAGPAVRRLPRGDVRADPPLRGQRADPRPRAAPAARHLRRRRRRRPRAARRHRGAGPDHGLRRRPRSRPARRPRPGPRRSRIGAPAGGQAPVRAAPVGLHRGLPCSHPVSGANTAVSAAAAISTQAAWPMAASARRAPPPRSRQDNLAPHTRGMCLCGCRGLAAGSAAAVAGDHRCADDGRAGLQQGRQPGHMHGILGDVLHRRDIRRQFGHGHSPNRP